MTNLGVGSGKYQHTKQSLCKECGAPRAENCPMALCEEHFRLYNKAKHIKYLNKERVTKGESEYLLDRQIKVLRWRGVDITKEQFKLLLISQTNKCKICSSSEPGGRGNWHVDHDHITLRVRGILCFDCNRMLGAAKDSIPILQSAISYLS
jgi:hypothetical protein